MKSKDHAGVMFRGVYPGLDPGLNMMTFMKIKTEWDLKELVSKESEVGKMRERAEGKIRAFKDKWAGNNLYLTDTNALFEALSDYEALNRDGGTTETVNFYYWLRSTIDQNDAEVRGKSNELSEWATKLGNEIKFFPIRVARLPKDMRDKVLADTRFAPYKHYLETSFAEAEHILSEPEEQLLSLKSAPAHEHWIDMIERLLAKEERDGVPFSGMHGLLSSPDRALRDKVAKNINEVVAKYVDVAESEINALFADKKVNDELRGFKRPDASRHLSDDIESEVVDALIAAVSKRNDIPARYYVLKAKLLGLPKLAYHERSIEYGKLPGEYSYEKALELVDRVFGSLDAEFQAIFRRFVESSQIDAFPKVGKAGGAFCATQLLSTPTYIMLNFAGKLNDVRTIAHEVGHGINNELMREKQNGLTFGTPMATAEVASTFMEDFVGEELRKEADEETRLALMVSKLNDDVSSIFRQVACYRFEQELHSEFRAKGYLSKEDIGKIFQYHMAAYMGSGVEQSAGSENWWVYWSHIRRFFYVYSYASGLLISKALQNSVRNDKKFITKVKEFLAAGTSASPKAIFAKCGIDIADPKFWESGLAEIDTLLQETEALAKKLGKI